MTISEFRDAVGKELHKLDGLSWECCTSREPNELDFEIHSVDGEWSYSFSATSWVSMFAAVQAAIANGDLDDPHEKYPEYYD